MKKFTQEQLITIKEAREKVISRVEVLDKVKGLLLLKQLDMATTKQVADFYEVDVDVISQLVSRNKEEIESDGYVIKTGREMKSLVTDKMSGSKIIPKRGYYIIETLEDSIRMSNNKNGLFPKRAILRVGMLLRDSEVAKEVRTQLLNIEEKAPKEIKSQDVDFQKEVAFEQFQAKMSGDWEAYEKAEMKIMNHLNKHINAVEYQLEKQKPVVSKFQSLINSKASLSATEIASSLIGKNGAKVTANDLNVILESEGYIKTVNKSKKLVTDKGLIIGGVQKSFNNGCFKVHFVEWTLNACQELDGVFKQYSIELDNSEEPVLS